MTSILQILPSELLARIFAFLPERQDVSQARLVCKVFHELSSPFLITEIIFAQRLDTLKRFKEVIEHPYFCRYVTRLIYDSSKYDGDLAIDWNGYVSRCEDAPRNMVDQEWLVRKHRDADLLDGLSNVSPEGRTTGRQGNGGRRTSYGMNTYYEEVYRMGCQRHFPDYYTRHRNQEALGVRRIPRDMIKRAFAACPKLHHVTYTDYRGLARAGETYDSCCYRLFDLTLEPDHAQAPRTRSWHQLWDLLSFASEAGARIDSLTVGPHRFVSLESILSSDLYSLEAPLMLPLANLPGEALAAFQDAFGRLDTLHLSYEDDHQSSTEATILAPILQPATHNIRHLSLNRAIDRNRSVAFVNTVGNHANEHEFLCMQFPRLRYLELRHFQLPHVQPLQTFLSEHASSLRELRLVEYCQTDRANEQDRLARWAGEVMRLEGVEILTAGDLQAVMTRTGDTGGRTSTSAKDTTIAETTLQNIEIREQLWLAGRSNSLGRSVDFAHWARFAADSEKWWLRPAQA